jgi:hypothetical protein
MRRRDEMCDGKYLPSPSLMRSSRARGETRLVETREGSGLQECRRFAWPLNCWALCRRGLAFGRTARLLPTGGWRASDTLRRNKVVCPGVVLRRVLLPDSCGPRVSVCFRARKASLHPRASCMQSFRARSVAAAFSRMPYNAALCLIVPIAYLEHSCLGDVNSKIVNNSGGYGMPYRAYRPHVPSERCNKRCDE